MNVGPTELLIIFLVILLLFGGSQLPKLARSLGRAQSEFKAGIDQREPATGRDDSSTTA